MRFVPERLVTLRHLKEMSMRALGELVNVSHSAISNYEKGVDQPRPAVVVRLAKVFGVSTEYFFRPVTLQISSVSYRKTSYLSKRQQRSIESQVQEHIEKYFLLEELTNSSKPPAIPTDRWKIERMADAEIAAEQLRNDWNLGGDPIPNVTELLEGKGIKVMFLEFANDYNGSSLWVNESIPVIICNRAFPGDRQRFTLVHELAHMVLDLDGEKDEEKVCHRFAAAFLAPRKAMFEKIGKKRTTIHLDELLILKQEYGLSLQALIRRCFDLGIMTKSAYTTYMRNFGARGWRKTEPGDQIPPEKSYRFQLLLKRAIAEDLISPSQFMELMGVRPARPTQISSEDLQKVAEKSIDLYSNDELTIFTKTNREDIIDYDG